MGDAAGLLCERALRYDYRVVAERMREVYSRILAAPGGACARADHLASAIKEGGDENMAAAYRRFLLLSYPRSGTHMLRTALDAHPNIRLHSEECNEHRSSCRGQSVDEILRELIAEIPPEIQAVGVNLPTEVSDHILRDDLDRAVMEELLAGAGWYWYL